jgi:ATP-dependent Zn protease
MERAEQLLRENRGKLDELADALMREETIGQEKIAEILGSTPVPAEPGTAVADMSAHD